MKLYRIATPARAHDLSGTGAKLHGGRWNAVGRAVVYASENISLAMLEVLVHASRARLQNAFSLCHLYLPDDVEIYQPSESNMPDGWRQYPFHPATRTLGNQWLEDMPSPLMEVPSAVNPLEYNFLINPAHPAVAGLEIVHIVPLTFDLGLR